MSDKVSGSDLIEQLWVEACRVHLGHSVSDRFAALIAEECAKVAEEEARDGTTYRADHLVSNFQRSVKFPKGVEK